MQYQTLETGPGLRQQYEDVAFTTLSVLWRWKWLIASFLVIALAGACVAILVLEKKYTADVLIQLNLGRDGGNEKAAAPGIALDPAALIETEARIISSRAIARRVVTSLGLEKIPDFAPRSSLSGKAFDWLNSLAEKSPIERLEAADDASNPTANLIAVELLKELSVTNDNRSYLIHITFTANSPVRSAAIANSFAEEYLRHRIEASSKQKFDALTAGYGPDHPAVVAARTKMEAAASNLGSDDVAQVVMWAEPIPLPSGPKRTIILGLAAVGGLGLGILLSLLLERRDTGFRTSVQLVSETGLPCLGMVPAVEGQMSRDTSTIESEAVRAISVALGLDVSGRHSTVVLTSSVPREGKTRLMLALARSLMASGRRTLVIDASPRTRSDGAASKSPALEEVVLRANSEHRFPDRLQSQDIRLLRRSSGPELSQRIFASQEFERMLKQAQELYDVLLIEAAPVHLFADAAQLSRFADHVVHVVRWNSTPRKVVKSSLNKLAGLNAHVTGTVLTNVNQKFYRAISNVVDVSGFYRDFAKQSVETEPLEKGDNRHVSSA